MAWPEGKRATSRNRYAVTPMLACCVVLRRLATPARWSDLEHLFGKHAPQLSEIFWEALEMLLYSRGHLITGDLSKAHLEANASKYAAAISSKEPAMSGCVGFIDGTVIAVSRPTDNSLQAVVYNGHKRRHGLKFQALVTPDGLILHAAGPLEGRRHDWTMFRLSGLDEQLENLLFIEGTQYFAYGDSGYTRRPWLQVPYQGSSLTNEQEATNRAASACRVTVEWIFQEVKSYWGIVDYRRKLRILQAPVGALYIASMLLTNFRSCFHPNKISQYFSCEPPSIQAYVSHR
jgi:hypothetical protein